MADETVSIPNYDCLQKLLSFPFFELPFKEPKESDHCHDQQFASVLCSFREAAKKKYPYLLKHVKNHCDLAEEIYNKSTCLKFHMLLCNVLHRFKESLEQLTNIKCVTSCQIIWTGCQVFWTTF